MGFLQAILGGSAVVALIEGFIGIIRWRLERKAKLQDSIKSDLEEWQKRMEANNAVQNEALKYILYDRIRFLGQAYIAAGEIDFDDRRILRQMHASYHNGLDGNGDLDGLMKEPLKKEGKS